MKKLVKNPPSNAGGWGSVLVRELKPTCLGGAKSTHFELQSPCVLGPGAAAKT